MENLQVYDVFSCPNEEQVRSWQKFLTRSFYSRKGYLLDQLVRTVTHRRELIPINIRNLPRLVTGLRSDVGELG